MKNLSLMFCVFFSLAAMAGQEVDLKEGARPDGLVRITNLRGELTIRGWDEPNVAVKGEIDDLAEKLIFEVKDDITVIEVKMPSQVGWGDGSELDIYLPMGSRLNVESVSTEISVTGMVGGVRINAISGDIDLNKTRGRLLVRTASGEVKIENSNGKIQVATASGEIRIDEHVGDVSIESVSGDIRFKARQTNSARVGSVSGSIDAKLAAVPGAVIEMKTISGEIEVHLEGGLNGSLDISTTTGDIDNELNDAKASSGFGNRRLLTEAGSGASEVTLRSVSGDIRIM